MDKITAMDIIKVLSVMESLCLRKDVECPDYVMDESGRLIKILTDYILEDKP